MTTRINPASAAPPAPHYSHGVVTPAGQRTLFVSGQVGLTREGVAPATVEEQLDLIWSNIEAVVTGADMKLTDIVNVRGYLLSPEAVPAYRSRFRAKLGDTRPTSTLVVVSALVSPHLLAEIEVVAVAP